MPRYPLNLPLELKRKAEEWASEQGVSLNQFIMWAVAEKVGALSQGLDDPKFPNITYQRGASRVPTPTLRGTGIRGQTLVIAKAVWESSPAEIAENYDLTESQVQEALDFTPPTSGKSIRRSHTNKLWKQTVSKTTLHLDADTSSKGLWKALLDHGYDVTRTPTDWMTRSSSDEDEEQLLGATAQGRCIFTFNIRDFLALSTRYSKHAGIILAAQSSWRLSAMIEALDKLLTETEAEEWVGQVRWLNDWVSDRE